MTLLNQQHQPIFIALSRVGYMNQTMS